VGDGLIDAGIGGGLVAGEGFAGGPGLEELYGEGVVEGEEVFREVILGEDLTCGAVEVTGGLVGGGGFGFVCGADIEADEVDEVAGLGEEGAAGVEVFGDFDELVFGLFVGEVLEEGLADAES
jgi:hypothetical protein